MSSLPEARTALGSTQDVLSKRWANRSRNPCESARWKRVCEMSALRPAGKRGTALKNWEERQSNKWNQEETGGTWEPKSRAWTAMTTTGSNSWGQGRKDSADHVHVANPSFISSRTQFFRATDSHWARLMNRAPTAQHWGLDGEHTQHTHTLCSSRAYGL